MTRGYIYINIFGAGYKAHNVQIFRTGSMNCAIPAEGFICIINPLLMNNLVCSHILPNYVRQGINKGQNTALYELKPQLLDFSK